MWRMSSQKHFANLMSKTEVLADGKHAQDHSMVTVQQNIPTIGYEGHQCENLSDNRSSYFNGAGICDVGH